MIMLLVYYFREDVYHLQAGLSPIGIFGAIKVRFFLNEQLKRIQFTMNTDTQIQICLSSIDWVEFVKVLYLKCVKRRMRANLSRKFQTECLSNV